MSLNEKEVYADFALLKHELEGIGIHSDIYEKDGFLGELGLLVMYDDESNYAAKYKAENGEDLTNAIVSYMFEIEETEEEQLNKYVLLYTELPGNYGDFDELELYRALDAFNAKTAMGYFSINKNEKGETKVRYKNTMYSPAGELINSVAYCEMVIQAIFYVELLTDILNGTEDYENEDEEE